jgi:dephospho-CoA kinase
MSKKNISLGITGGIGSGKSYVCHILEQLQIPVFYTDIEAQHEMCENHEIHVALSDLLGKAVITSEGQLNKALISSYICRGDDYAARIDAIVHPQVRMKLRQWLSKQNSGIKAVECALLFESHFDTEVDKKILITAPLEVRIKRVMERDGKLRTEVLNWISLQMPEEQKMKLSDYIIINDGKSSIYEQVNHLLSII